jgi:glycosyltransferase involved in cell wall biosynthesis
MQQHLRKLFLFLHLIQSKLSLKASGPVRFTTNTYASVEKPLFSLVIPTWNNLDMLQLCIRSILQNSKFKHQIILHINEGNDGTKAWAEEQQITHTFSEINIGVCYAVNIAAALAKTEYILYLNDDMYVCPDWDSFLWKEIQLMPDKLFYLSATAIEPFDAGKKCAITPFSYGKTPADFREAELLADFKTLPMQDWNGASWPPGLVHRDIWNAVGGYGVEFFPGFYSDPDFSLKLWQIGVRNFKGVAGSRVYHFLEHSTKRLGNKKVKAGNRLFLNKWGITANMFYKFYLRMGTPYHGPLPEVTENNAFKLKRLTSKIKRLFSKISAL